MKLKIFAKSKQPELVIIFEAFTAVKIQIIFWIVKLAGLEESKLKNEHFQEVSSKIIYSIMLTRFHKNLFVSFMQDH